MKIYYYKNDEKEMKALIGFEPAYNGKRMDFLLAATLPNELSMLTQQLVFKTTHDF